MPWLAVAAGSIIMPWTLYLAIPNEIDALAPAMIWKALWPVLLGAVLAVALWRQARWFERGPEGEITMAERCAAKGAVACGRAVERMDRALRSWPAAGVSLLILMMALGAAVLVR